MCGRFTLTVELSEVAEAFSAGVSPALDGHEPRYNIAPTEDAPVVIAGPEGWRTGPMRWGLVPPWAESPRVGARMINARSETAATRNPFRESFVARRCLVPADGFYEWETREDGKQPYWIHRRGSDLFAMAGIWALWRGDGGTPLATFTILTRNAPVPVRWLHHRSPVILPERHWTDWLARGTAPETLHAILAETESPELWLHPVTRAVNRAGYDEPHCIDEVKLDSSEVNHT